MYALAQYDDRPLADFEPLFAQNARYAQKHDILHVAVNSGYAQYPPWWRKVFLVNELLPHYDAVMWVDSDAAIVGDAHFSELFCGKHFVMSPNPPMLESPSLSMFSAPFCAGVWGVRNTPEGRALMARWVGAYDSSAWVQSGGEWRATRGPYAGEAYEQGSFELAIWRCCDYTDWVENKPSWQLNYLPLPDERLRGSTCPPGVFAVHYWKGNRGHIRQHWSK